MTFDEMIKLGVNQGAVFMLALVALYMLRGSYGERMRDLKTYGELQKAEAERYAASLKEDGERIEELLRQTLAAISTITGALQGLSEQIRRQERRRGGSGA